MNRIHTARDPLLRLKSGSAQDDAAFLLGLPQIAARLVDEIRLCTKAACPMGYLRNNTFNARRWIR